MVPLNHYKQDDAKLLLQSMFGISKKDAVVAEPVPGWQMHNIYAVPKEVYDWAQAFSLPAITGTPYSIGIRNSVVTDFEGSLAADFRADDFSLVVTRGVKVLLTQTFPYSSPADVVYYLLDTCRQVFISAGDGSSITGRADREGFRIIQGPIPVFLHIRFRKPEWRIHALEKNDYPEHFFTSLNLI